MEQKKRTEIALVPGSYDPVTKGHEYLIAKAAEEYEKVYAVIFVNSEKQCRFSLEKRLEMLEAVCKKYPNVTADADTGMQYAYARRVGATVAVRGWRSEEDLEYEQKMAKFNAENLPVTEWSFGTALRNWRKSVQPQCAGKWRRMGMFPL